MHLVCGPVAVHSIGAAVLYSPPRYIAQGGRLAWEIWLHGIQIICLGLLRDLPWLFLLYHWLAMFSIAMLSIPSYGSP